MLLIRMKEEWRSGMARRLWSGFFAFRRNYIAVKRLGQ